MQDSSAGSVRVTRRSNIVAIEFAGRVAGHTVEAAVVGLAHELRTGRTQLLIIDCTTTTTYAADVRGPGIVLLETARRGGVERVACVSLSAAIRMMGSVVAFGAQVAVDFVATRREAEALVGSARGARVRRQTVG
jgi:hypothetical protein